MTALPSPQSDPVRIADIGGTNARFALLWKDRSEADLLPPTLTANHADAMDAIRQIVHVGAHVRPKRAVLAVAAPMADESFKLTNGPWSFSPRKILGALGLEEITFLNDFEAQALALPFLSPRIWWRSARARRWPARRNWSWVRVPALALPR